MTWARPRSRGQPNGHETVIKQPVEADLIDVDWKDKNSLTPLLYVGGTKP
jgi:hypothetical protein